MRHAFGQSVPMLTFSHTRLAAMASLLVGLLVGSMGCVVGPLPSPPNVQLDTTRVVAEDGNGMDGFRLSGYEGAVEPATGRARYWDLDSPLEDALFADVQADGSFEIFVAIPPWGGARVQVLAGSSRSQPLDLIRYPDGTVAPPPPGAFSDCLRLSPALELDFEAAATGQEVEGQVQVLNNCGQELTLGALRFAAGGVFQIRGGNTERTLAPGESFTATLSGIVPDRGASIEDLIFIEVTSPETDTRRVGLVLRGPD